ncbi:MAG: CPP1-like family protein [Synechococcaceae cyanobacterium]|nr:CPP1-like family protein [Synechococcaceae cyanobacterium]
MTSGPDPTQDPYTRLGITPEAGFDEVQAARQRCLDAVPDDPLERARVEASYDAVLMRRLKERQQGKVSSAARSASQREQTTALRPSLPRLPSLPQLNAARPSPASVAKPSFVLASGRDLLWPLAGFAVLLLVLLAVPSVPPDLLLSLATGLTLLQILRRQGRFLLAVGWSFGLLVAGLLGGAMLLFALSGATPAALPAGLPLGAQQLQSLPALVALLLGALLVA